jgi:hypothetical protein
MLAPDRSLLAGNPSRLKIGDVNIELVYVYGYVSRVIMDSIDDARRLPGFEAQTESLIRRDDPAAARRRPGLERHRRDRRGRAIRVVSTRPVRWSKIAHHLSKGHSQHTDVGAPWRSDAFSVDCFGDRCSDYPTWLNAQQAGRGYWGYPGYWR